MQRARWNPLDKERDLIRVHIDPVQLDSKEDGRIVCRTERVDFRGKALFNDRLGRWVYKEANGEGPCYRRSSILKLPGSGVTAIR